MALTVNVKKIFDARYQDVSNNVPIDGTLDALNISGTASVNVKAYGATGDGVTDDSTAIQNALNSGGTTDGSAVSLYFPPGTYLCKNLSIGNASNGVSVRIIGESPASTTLLASGANGILTVQGAGTVTGGFFEMRNIGLRTTQDIPYTTPLVKLIRIGHPFLIENIKVTMYNLTNPGITNAYTGTVFWLDTTYEGDFRDINGSSNNKYAVPFELRNDVASAQMDTISFVNFLFGTNGPIFRNPSGGLHGINATGLKIVTGNNTFGNFSESTVGTLANTGDTTVALNPGDGASFTNIPCAVWIGAGSTGEANKINSISTDTITLAQPLRFSHSVGAQVFTNGYGVATSGNSQGFLFQTCHFEGMGVGAMLDNVSGMTFQNCYSGAREFIRMTSSAVDTFIGETLMSGNSSTNTLVKIPSWNTAGVQRINIQGPIIKGSSAPAVTYINDPGSNFTNGTYRELTTSGGNPQEIIQGTAGAGSTAARQIFKAGSEVWSLAYDGSQLFSQQAKLFTGTGAPEGVKTAGIGSIYIRTDGGYSGVVYVKANGSGNTGWTITDPQKAKYYRNGGVPIYESFDPSGKTFSFTAATPLTSSLGLLVGVYLPPGAVVTNILVKGGNTLATLGSNNDSHWFFALYSSAATPALLAQTADQTTTAWAATNDLPLQSPVTITSEGWYYYAAFMNAGTGGSPVYPNFSTTSIGATAISGTTLVSGMKMFAGTATYAGGATAPSTLASMSAITSHPYILGH